MNTNPIKKQHFLAILFVCLFSFTKDRVHLCNPALLEIMCFLYLKSDAFDNKSDWRRGRQKAYQNYTE